MKVGLGSGAPSVLGARITVVTFNLASGTSNAIAMVNLGLARKVFFCDDPSGEFIAGGSVKLQGSTSPTGAGSSFFDLPGATFAGGAAVLAPIDLTLPTAGGSIILACRWIRILGTTLTIPASFEIVQL